MLRFWDPGECSRNLNMQLDARARRASFLSVGVYQCEFVLTTSSHLAVRLDRFPEDGFPAEAGRWELHGREVILCRHVADVPGREAAEASEAF